MLQLSLSAFTPQTSYILLFFPLTFHSLSHPRSGHESHTLISTRENYVIRRRSASCVAEIQVGIAPFTLASDGTVGGRWARAMEPQLKPLLTQHCVPRYDGRVFLLSCRPKVLSPYGTPVGLVADINGETHIRAVAAAHSTRGISLSSFVTAPPSVVAIEALDRHPQQSGNLTPHVSPAMQTFRLAINRS